MLRYTKLSLTSILILVFNYITAQTYNVYYNTIANNCTYASVENNINEFVGHGVKEVGTTELENALNWLKDKYTSYGYTDIVEDSFTYGGYTITNLIVTKTGLVYPDTYVIVDGHYDSINGVGANDNGSGTAVILEAARRLVNVPTEYSIRFIHFTAEEIGLIGSQHYVNNTVIPQNMDIKVLLNIDQVGGRNGMTNDTIVCERDTGSPSSNNAASNIVTNELATCVGLYSNLSTEISYAYSSDYMPFEENGEIITGLYEKNVSPHSHSPNDIIANMDINYVYEIAKATTGAIMHFAVANEALSIDDYNSITKDIRVYPNPAKNYININFANAVQKKASIKMVDINGRTVLNQTITSTKATESIEFNNASSGHYTLIITIEGDKKIEKIIIE